MKLNENQHGLLEQIIFAMIDMSGKAQTGLEEADIDAFIRDVLINSRLDADEEDKERLHKNVEHHYHVHHIEGGAIYDDYDSRRDWYTSNPPTNNFFWNRYKNYLRINNKVDYESLKRLEEETLPNIMNCLGDPNESFDGQRLRRGLVIGDVQSGKTSTYAGLICMAADAGYKVVILLTGITENLRVQTQGRIDESVIGYTLTKDSKTLRPVGVGTLGNGEAKASSYTSCVSDFTSVGGDSIISSLSSHNSVLVFAVKKNASILNNLHEWLKRDFNIDASDGLIHAPLLLIDDEADNASINTNKDASLPTKINNNIRKICSAFKDATYVGFTATPFANIFIDPDTPESMEMSDLFPEHFIYVLPIPDTYIGATKIFYQDSKYYDNLKFISDVEEPTEEEFENNTEEDWLTRPYYMAHTKEWHGKLPHSLKEAIYCFLLANVIRDLRGDSSKPRTMMVNMSRFVKVQNHITKFVNDVMRSVKNEVQFNFSDDNGTNANRPLYKELKSLWQKHYSYLDMDVERILNKANLFNAIKSIEVLTINGGKSSSQLDYTKTSRIIAIGGLALSRGLTLEGLLVSYFYRNTATFDVLMQMGRWFGYRPNYDDIFQIWTSQTSAEWYAEVAFASEELKTDVRQMFLDRLKPKDFGIRVRNESEILQITAANKMRLAHNFELQVSFWGGYFETPYVARNPEPNERNLTAVRELIKTLADNQSIYEPISTQSESRAVKSRSLLVRNVTKDVVLSFLEKINFTKKNMHFDTDQIYNFVSKCKDQKLNKWDIAFRSGASNESYKLKEGVEIPYIVRKLSDANGSIGFSYHNLLASPHESLAGLSKEQMEIVRQAYKEENKGRYVEMPPNEAWFKHMPDRNPLLTIYLVKPNLEKSITDKDKENNDLVRIFCESLGDNPLVGLSIGFPQNGENSAKTMKYKVNKVYYKLLMESYAEDNTDIID